MLTEVAEKLVMTASMLKKIQGIAYSQREARELFTHRGRHSCLYVQVCLLGAAQCPGVAILGWHFCVQWF